MRRHLLLLEKLRARRASHCWRDSISSSTTVRCKHSVAVQLDYYLSPQFGGVAAALVNDTYAKKGIVINFLPICPVGEEMKRVRHYQNEHKNSVAMGTVEQNIFIPTLYKDKRLDISGAAAMFNSSPLCIASITDQSNTIGATIGAHEDTVDLLKRIFPQQNIIATPRATKVTDLLSGKVDAIQAYLTTEVLKLRRELPEFPVVVPLEGISPANAKLGYGQVIFSTNETLECEVERKDIVRAFLEATFEGWQAVIDSPRDGVKMVEEAKKMVQLDEENNDHWQEEDEFKLEMLQQCNDLVNETKIGGRLGVIVPDRWDKATEWLLNDKKAEKEFGLNPFIWS